MGTLKNWTLNNTETGKSCGTNSKQIFNVYVPKVLPLVSFEKPKTETVALNKSCFINDASCKPSVSSTITLKNYIEMYLSSNSKLSTSSLAESPIKHGTELKIEIQNKNVDKMFVISTADKKYK